MPIPVISATGLFTPSDSISNVELVNSFNTYVAQHNAEHAAAIAAREVAALEPSSVEFIEKASGIRARYVLAKAPILDPAIMAPRWDERPNEQISVLAEIGVAAAKDALARAGRAARAHPIPSQPAQALQAARKWLSCHA
jgi:beta-ketodecanoyl-[acyl-carrier-protein] synthase